jgi:hypothetical protein
MSLVGDCSHAVPLLLLNCPRGKKSTDCDMVPIQKRARLAKCNRAAADSYDRPLIPAVRGTGSSGLVA